jgi:hypothetical protein
LADLNKLIGAPVDVLRVFVMYKFQIEKGLNSSDNDRHANPEVGERPMAKCINGYRYFLMHLLPSSAREQHVNPADPFLMLGKPCI